MSNMSLIKCVLRDIIATYQQDSPIYCEHCANDVGGQTTQGKHHSGCPIARLEYILETIQVICPGCAGTGKFGTDKRTEVCTLCTGTGYAPDEYCATCGRHQHIPGGGIWLRVGEAVLCQECVGRIRYYGTLMEEVNT